jgi:hypothetical protein
MIFGNNTRTYLQEHQLTFSNQTTKEPPLYKTRLQENLNNMATISIPMRYTTKNDIHTLLKIMESRLPGIYYYKTDNICEGVSIHFNNRCVVLSGSNKYLYNFLSSDIGIYLLATIWEDNKNPNQHYQLTNYEYTNHFNVETLESCQECSICQQHIQEGIRTKCNHYFHSDCLQPWLTKMCSKPTCPNCRNSLDVYSLC